MSDEYNKGYFSAGPQRSYEARQGQADRREKERQAQEQQERAAREQRSRDLERQIRSASRPLPGQNPSTNRSGRNASEPATLQNCVKGCAIAGMLIFVAYAVLGRNMTGWVVLGWWGLQGAFAGALSGVAVYIAIVLLRGALVVLGFAVRIAFFALLAFGALYLLRGLG